MASVNKVILVGNLGADPDTHYFNDGGSVTNITIATTESWKDKNTGEKRERTEWHRVVFYRRLAEVAAEYLRKGSQVYVEGSLQTRKWKDRDDIERYTTEIVARSMQMLGSRQQSREQHGRSQQSANAGASKSRTSSRTSGPANPPPVEFDDDIPF